MSIMECFIFQNLGIHNYMYVSHLYLLHPSNPEENNDLYESNDNARTCHPSLLYVFHPMRKLCKKIDKIPREKTQSNTPPSTTSNETIIFISHRI